MSFLINPYIFGAVAAPLDIDDYTNQTLAFSLRAVSSSHIAAAGKCIKIRRSSDNATQIIGFSGGLGSWVDDATITTFLGGSTGYVEIWYDQSGNGDHVTQTTLTSQPVLVADVFSLTGGTAWSVSFDGTVDNLTRDGGSNIFGSANLTMYLAYYLDTSAFDAVFSVNAAAASSSNYWKLFRWSTAGRFYANGYNNTLTGTTNPVLEQIVLGYNGTTQFATINDGTPDTLAATGATARRYFTLGAGADSATQNWGGQIAEFLWFDASHSAGDEDTIRDDQNTIYTLY